VVYESLYCARGQAENSYGMALVKSVSCRASTSSKIPVPVPKPDSMTQLVRRAWSNSYPVGADDGRTMIPLTAG
jgi:hypothetical protein